MTSESGNPEYTLERRQNTVGHPAYQTFTTTFINEENNTRQEYHQIAEDFQDFYNWRINTPFSQEITAAASKAVTGSIQEAAAILGEDPEFDTLFEVVYMEDLEDSSDLDGFPGMKAYLQDFDTEEYLSNHDELGIVSENGAMLNVQRRGEEHRFNWVDTVQEDRDHFAHDVFAEYMEHLKNERAPWR